MQDINCIIELKRGLHKICSIGLVNAISELNKFEEFYQDIFLIYGLTYNEETIRQKRTFVASTTKYFILDRLPEDSLYLNDDKYDSKIKEKKELLGKVIDTYFVLRDGCSSNEDFKKKYAEYFNEEVKDFSMEISENRDDSLSDFAKAVQKVYYSNDKNKGNC